MRSLTVSWSDPQALAEAARSLPGLEFLRAIRDGRLPPPPMAELLGFKLVEAEPGHAVFEVLPGERHYNPIGVVHGGLAMTLLEPSHRLRAGCAPLASLCTWAAASPPPRRAWSTVRVGSTRTPPPPAWC